MRAARWINVVSGHGKLCLVQPVTFAMSVRGWGGNVSTFHDEDLRGFRNERKGNLFILHLCEEKNSRKGAKGEFASVRGEIRVAKLKGIKDKSRRRD